LYLSRTESAVVEVLRVEVVRNGALVEKVQKGRGTHGVHSRKKHIDSIKAVKRKRNKLN